MKASSNPHLSIHWLISLLTLLTILPAILAGSLPADAAPNKVDNAGWTELGTGSASGGGISNDLGYSWPPTLAIGPDGFPIIAWEDGRVSQEIFVRRWNGSAWVTLGAGSASGGGISNNAGTSRSPSIATGSDGLPVVVWADDSAGDREIYVRRWNGSVWAEMGSGSASGGGISNNNGDSWDPFVAIGDDGFPIVAWDDNSSGNYEIYIRRWNGSTWIEMGPGSFSGGGISNNTTNSRTPALAIGTDGQPVVAWEDGTGNDEQIYVKRWNGSAWVEMGNDSASGGGISSNSGRSADPSVVIGADGRPLVAWEDGSSANNEIYVRHWNGSAWVEMGSGSASGGGISSNAGDSWDPSLAIGSDGFPIVTWYDRSNGTKHEIYVRHWNGSAWTEMGSGSASGGGVSNSAGDSWGPSIAVGADGQPVVAWSNENGSNNEIYVRRYGQTTCLTLTLTHVGQGSNPTASPANSSGCPNGQYTAGQSISLTASPASGWRVAGWSGTNNNSSTSTTNTLTMPSGNHTVSVTYEQASGSSFTSFIPIHLGPPIDPCALPLDEGEPNNVRADARAILCPGRVYTGLPNDETDIFYIDTTRPANLSAVLSNHVGGDQLQLYYESLTIDARVDYDHDPSNGFRVDYQGPAGRYFVVIVDLNHIPSTTSLYSLVVTVD